jgi:orotidine-5'-phosphate decarboxylase
MGQFADRLADAVRRKGPLCVGIDPRLESLPRSVRERHESAAAAFEYFAGRVIELVEPYAGVIKVQSAFFEQYAALHSVDNVLSDAHANGFVTILDAKRGDIASTATAYAEAAFHTLSADSLTVNPYLGEDAVQPFLDFVHRDPVGLFVLVRTSNPGGGLFQNLVCDGKPVYRHVADAVVKWNAPTVGTCGLGDVGAVVGATHPRELAELRAAMPDVWFLVPGYGAQGGTAADVKAAYRPDGLGAVVNSSRGVTFPFHPDDPDWEAKVTAAAAKAAAELRA